MDAVYVVRPGEANEPLRFSLRSLVNVDHGEVHIFGHAPSWVRNVSVVERPRLVSSYHTVTRHIAAACLDSFVSDPFMLWNDDFYATKPVGRLPSYHRGPLATQVKQFENRHDEWAASLRATARILEPDALSYELHVPMIVHKTQMLAAIALIDRLGISSACRRTVYGNLAGLDGTKIPDPKMVWDWPDTQWVSSHPASFNVRAKPNLRRLFPTAGPYEAASEGDLGPSPVHLPTENLPEPQIGSQNAVSNAERDENGRTDRW